MSVLQIENDGPKIVATNFWETDAARAGKLFVSLNAGAFRVLIPAAVEYLVQEMKTAKEVLIYAGPWPAQKKDLAFELVFDDRSDSPFAIHLSTESFDRLPAASDYLEEWICSVWTQPRRGVPHKSFQRIAYLAKAPRLPWLKPRKHKGTN